MSKHIKQMFVYLVKLAVIWITKSVLVYNLSFQPPRRPFVTPLQQFANSLRMHKIGKDLLPNGSKLQFSSRAAKNLQIRCPGEINCVAHQYLGFVVRVFFIAHNDLCDRLT